jgi:hypothetical protein
MARTFPTGTRSLEQRKASSRRAALLRRIRSGQGCEAALNITVDTFGSRLYVDGTEIGGFRRIGNMSGMTIFVRLNADDAGQKALAAASVSGASRDFGIVFKDGEERRFRAGVASCEMEGDDLRAVLSIEPGSITKERAAAR